MTKRISVCHIASGDRWAGAEAQVATLLRALRRREDLCLSTILLNEGHLAEEARSAGIELKVIPEGQKGFLQIFLEADRYLRGRGIQILHSHRYKENLLAALLAWRRNIPYVVRSQHGLPEPFGGLKQMKHAIFQVADQMVARYSTDTVICVSAELRSRLARYLDPGKTVVIHNGVDVEQVRSTLTSNDAKKRLGIPGDTRVVGTVGRLDPIKRLDIFLAAAHAMSKQVPNVRFVILGEGSEEHRLREQARALRLQNSVFFLGQRQDVYDVVRAFDLFVLCSDHEGLPMALLEALALAVPVVACRTGGISEVIEDGVNGVLLATGDPSALAEACLHLLADRCRRAGLAAAGMRRVAEAFSAREAAAQVARVYVSLCSVP